MGKEKTIKAWAVVLKGEDADKKPYVGFVYENVKKKYIDTDFATAIIVDDYHEKEIRQYLRERKAHGLHRSYKVVPVEIKIII